VHTLRWVEKNNVHALTDTKCIAIEEDGVIVDNQNGQTKLEADTVVLCVGIIPLTDERNAFFGHAFDVINVGDCKKAGTIRQAVDTAYSAAMIL